MYVAGTIAFCLRLGASLVTTWLCMKAESTGGIIYVCY